MRRTAQAEALRLAERGVDVLEIEFASRVPYDLLAHLPSLGPWRELPGYTEFVFLIDKHRVVVSVDVPLRRARAVLPEGGTGSHVVIRVEPLDGPFPHLLPAGN